MCFLGALATNTVPTPPPVINSLFLAEFSCSPLHNYLQQTSSKSQESRNVWFCGSVLCLSLWCRSMIVRRQILRSLRPGAGGSGSSLLCVNLPRSKEGETQSIHIDTRQAMHCICLLLPNFSSRQRHSYFWWNSYSECSCERTRGANPVPDSVLHALPLAGGGLLAQRGCAPGTHGVYKL